MELRVKHKIDGFSLIEVLIVVLIIGIIAALAIPNLLAARRSANEANAISSLRNYHAAQATYQSTIGAGEYAGTPELENAFNVLFSKGLIDDSFVNPSNAIGDDRVKSGYGFTGHGVKASNGTPACHNARATPIVETGITQTGTHSYVIATEGVVYSSPNTWVFGWQYASGIGYCLVSTDENLTPLNN